MKTRVMLAVVSGAVAVMSPLTSVFADTSQSISASSQSPVMNGAITLTPDDIAKGQAREAQILQFLNQALAQEHSPTSGGIVPAATGGNPPASAYVSTGTMTETDTGSTCGPISAHNLLYHMDGSNTPSISTLESQLGWTDSAGTGYGSNWSSTLNADQNWYSYTVSPTYPGVTAVYDNSVYDFGSAVVPNILNIVGYLPGYQSGGSNYVRHYVTGDQYGGWGTNNASTESLGWYDESDLNTQGHNIDYTVSQLNTYASDGELSFQGNVF